MFPGAPEDPGKTVGTDPRHELYQVFLGEGDTIELATRFVVEYE